MSKNLSRQELYDLVWAQPMIKAAKQFEVSGSYLARMCTLMNVPRPDRGHWAKVAVGRANAPVPLPEPRPGDQLYWYRGGERQDPPVPKNPPQRRRKPKNQVAITETHKLIIGARVLFEKSYPIKDGEYLKPYKKLLVDIVSSKACLEKALGFANELFNALETVGHRVAIAPAHERCGRGDIDEREDRRIERRMGYYRSVWSPQRGTVVYVGDVVIGLTIVEMSESVLLRYVDGEYVREYEYTPPRKSRYSSDYTWTTTQELPSGRLRLMAYSPHWRVDWSLEWEETKTSPLGPKIESIIRSLEKGAVELVGKIAEVKRAAEIAHQKWLEEEERRNKEQDRENIKQSIKKSSDHLKEIIQQWAATMSVEQFLAGVSDRAEKLSEKERGRALERLRLAREFLGSQDPMDYFLVWKTPEERYKPLYEHSPLDVEDEADEE